MKINEITEAKVFDDESDIMFYDEIKQIIINTGRKYNITFHFNEEEEDMSSTYQIESNEETGWWRFSTYGSDSEDDEYVGIYVSDISSDTKGLTTEMFKNILDFLQSRYEAPKRMLTIAGGISGQLNKAVGGWAKVAARINAEYETSEGY